MAVTNYWRNFTGFVARAALSSVFSDPFQCDIPKYLNHTAVATYGIYAKGTSTYATCTSKFKDHIDP